MKEAWIESPYGAAAAAAARATGDTSQGLGFRIYWPELLKK